MDPSDPVTLVVAYHMGAETTGEFTKQEFLNGMRAMRCQSLQELQASEGTSGGWMGVLRSAACVQRGCIPRDHSSARRRG